jgi:hypothetical protein
MSTNQQVFHDLSLKFRKLPLFKIISGAKYSGVPQRVYVFSFPSTILEKPKSISFMYPFPFIKMFSGFKSLYMIFLECKYSKTVTI